jgi:holo-[acyl-carrier protein] synthase
MILGIGNDILEIDRVRKAIQAQGNRFLSRILTKKEQEYCQKFKNPFPHIAGRFSAKEAVVKALGSGFGEMASWLDIEILNNKLGKPEVRLSKGLKKKVKKSIFLVSISHCRTYVTTMALWIKS